MKYPRFWILVMTASLFVVGIVAAATNPDSTWNKAANGVLIPECSSGGNSPKHWSFPASYEPREQAKVWDAFKTNGYSNIRLDYGGDKLFMNADCTLGA